MNVEKEVIYETEDDFASQFNCDPDLAANDNEENLGSREASFLTSGFHHQNAVEDEDAFSFEGNEPNELSFHEQPYGRRGFLSE